VGLLVPEREPRDFTALCGGGLVGGGGEGLWEGQMVGGWGWVEKILFGGVGGGGWFLGGVVGNSVQERKGKSSRVETRDNLETQKGQPRSGWWRKRSRAQKKKEIKNLNPNGASEEAGKTSSR